MLGLSQQQTTDMIGVTYRQAYKYERGVGGGRGRFEHVLAGKSGPTFPERALNLGRPLVLHFGIGLAR